MGDGGYPQSTPIRDVQDQVLSDSPEHVVALSGLIRLARPANWIKNVFVLIPVPFAIAAGFHLEKVPFLCGLLGFCLINSAAYTLKRRVRCGG